MFSILILPQQPQEPSHVAPPTPPRRAQKQNLPRRLQWLQDRHRMVCSQPLGLQRLAHRPAKHLQLCNIPQADGFDTGLPTA
jgi:hypothetical protein